MDTYATATTTGGSAIEETDRLIASDKVEGTAVYNRQNERLGTVHNFMVDKSTGQVAYAVMSFGGFRSRPQPARESAELCLIGPTAAGSTSFTAYRPIGA